MSRRKNEAGRAPAGLLLGVAGAVLALAAAGWFFKQRTEPELKPDPAVRGEPIVAPPATNADQGSILAALAKQAANSNQPPVPKKLPRTPARSGEYVPVNFTLLARFILRLETEGIAQPGDSPTGWSQVQDQIPEEVRALDGSKVAVAGFMLPIKMNGDRVAEFLLLRNQNACCFGLMPRVNEMIVVRTAGQGVRSIMDTPITVTGTLHVRGVSESGRLLSIYEIDCDQAVDASAL